MIYGKARIPLGNAGNFVIGSFDIPVLVIAYRREETTRLILEALRKIKPRLLYVSLNAPNPDNLQEIQQCEETKLVFESVDWDCQLLYLIRKEHLCAKDSIVGAINWFFSQVEMGIILEDDCLPSDTFFYFAQEMLLRYAYNKKVGMISGNCFSEGCSKNSESYYFSKYTYIWGWATWRDRWLSIDLNMIAWRSSKEEILRELSSFIEKWYWSRMFEKTYKGQIDTWDTQWFMSNLKEKRVSITPTKNLVTNIGFGKKAHLTKELTPAANIALRPLNFPLAHPKRCIPSINLDKQIFMRYYFFTSIRLFIKNKLFKLYN